MEFEVARCRPMLGDDFFAYLDRRIGGPRPLGGTQLWEVLCVPLTVLWRS